MFIHVSTLCFVWLLGGALAVAIGVILGCLGWSMTVCAGAATILGMLFAALGSKYLTLLRKAANAGRAETVSQAGKHVGRVHAVFITSVCSAAMAYAGLAGYLGWDPRFARWLERFPNIAPAVEPKSWGLQFEWADNPARMPIWVLLPPEKPGILGALRYIAAIGVGGIAGLCMRQWLIPPDDMKKSRRGRTLLAFANAQHAANKTRDSADPGIFFGGLWLPSAAATSHWAVTGTTGSGKTLTHRLLEQVALPSIGAGYDQRAIVYDGKQDGVSYLYGMDLGCPVHIFSPLDVRCVAWDIGRDCDSPAVAMQIASNLIPEEEGPNRFFSDAGRHELTGVVTSLAKTCPGDWDLRDLVLAMQDGDVIRQLVERIPETRHLLQYSSDPRTYANIISSLATKMSRFEPVAAAWSHAMVKISLKDWIRSEFILVLGNDERIRFAMDAINRVIFRIASELILAQPESATRRNWVFLDEPEAVGVVKTEKGLV